MRMPTLLPFGEGCMSGEAIDTRTRSIRRGGRMAVGLLPNVLANPLARLEPYGMMILIGLLIVLPLLGSQLGVDLSFVSHLLSISTGSVIRLILQLTGNM
jgi:hypothetical protein